MTRAQINLTLPLCKLGLWRRLVSDSEQNSSLGGKTSRSLFTFQRKFISPVQSLTPSDNGRIFQHQVTV